VWFAPRRKQSKDSDPIERVSASYASRENASVPLMFSM